ncbi:MAG: extracellular solute-binding protein [Planctomycetes bacterium]|nr:extracellular solute-binding protein [Planctomycetota bacterium]
MPRPLASCLLSLPLALAACGDSGPTIRVALDQEFSEPLLNRFGTELGIPVRQLHDTEASKTVGHVSAIRTEAEAPRCDVFWNNELANTVALAQQGLLAPYESPAAADIPARWKDPQGRWTAFAARARILIVNTELLPEKAEWPKGYRDLVDPKWKGRCAIAKPLTGTSLTHFTALHELLGEQALDELFDRMEQNDVEFLASNGATMKAVRDGRLAWAFTDTDDCNVAKLKGFPVACVYPDQAEGEIGTMLIPNSVGIVKDAPHPEDARKLVDKILARTTEAELAAADGAQIPLRSGVPGPSNPEILEVGEFREMAWDIERVAGKLAECSAHFAKRFKL